MNIKEASQASLLRSRRFTKGKIQLDMVFSVSDEITCNATIAGNAYGKKAYEYLRSSRAQEYIQELEKSYREKSATKNSIRNLSCIILL